MEGTCSVCLDNHPISNFRVLPCGHCLCRECTGPALRLRRSSCPYCREPVVGGTNPDVRPLHLPELIHPASAQAQRVVAKLNTMSDKTSAASIEKTPKKIEELIGGCVLPDEVVDALQQAIEDLRIRIAPAFKINEALKAQLDEARKARKDSEDALADRQEAYNNIRTTLKVRNAELLDMTGNRDEWKRKARECHDKLQIAKVEREEADRLKAENERLEKERTRYRGWLEERKKRTDQLKRDLRMEREKIAELTRVSQAQASQLPALGWDENDTTMTETLLPSSPRTVLQDFEFEVDLDEEDDELVPATRFSSDWQLSKGVKRKKLQLANSSGGLAAEVLGLRNGRPSRPIQLGSKRSLRAPI